MKKDYQSPESKIISIRTNDILTNSTEAMNAVGGSWDIEEEW